MVLNFPRHLKTILPILALIVLGSWLLLRSGEDLSEDTTLVEHGHIDAGGYDPHAIKEFDDLNQKELVQNLIEDEHRQHVDAPSSDLEKDAFEHEVVFGGVIMDKLVNETAKAELGRAAWRVLHLTTLRFPNNPSPSDRKALEQFMYLFSRLYPCGECALEFQQLLKQYPPQTSSRKSASLWLCFLHNLVNERLGKEEFDCLGLDEAYDCGCGDEGAVNGTSTGAKAEDGNKVDEVKVAALPEKVHKDDDDEAEQEITSAASDIENDLDDK